MFERNDFSDDACTLQEVYAEDLAVVGHGWGACKRSKSAGCSCIQLEVSMASTSWRPAAALFMVAPVAGSRRVNSIVSAHVLPVPSVTDRR